MLNPPPLKATLTSLTVYTDCIYMYTQSMVWIKKLSDHVNVSSFSELDCVTFPLFDI